MRMSQLLNESAPKNQLKLLPLPYDQQDLAPALSQDTVNYHYGKLAKGYVERYNAGQGDPDFNQAGAFLHNILFSQYQKASNSNKPEGPALEFIQLHYKTVDLFKAEFSKIAMTIQGSGWVYLSRDGTIRTIKNHTVKKDIVLLIDWWEHAFQFDYGSDKEKYLINQWKIINWQVVGFKL